MGRLLESNGVARLGPARRAADLAAKFLGSTGAVGEHYGDRWEYVRQNPVRAGLAVNVEDWPFQGEIEVLRW